MQSVTFAYKIPVESVDATDVQDYYSIKICLANLGVTFCDMDQYPLPGCYSRWKTSATIASCLGKHNWSTKTFRVIEDGVSVALNLLRCDNESIELFQVPLQRTSMRGKCHMNSFSGNLV